MAHLLALLVITHVTLIDTEAGRARPDVTVVISGDRITAVAPAETVKVPRGAKIIDGRGKFLIPGLVLLGHKQNNLV